MKNTIPRIDLLHLRNEAHVQLNQNFVTLVEKYNPVTLKIENLYNLYTPLFNRELSALDTIRKSEITSDIEKQDSVRDRLFRGFADAIKSFLNHFDADKRKAAQILQIVMDNYGNIAIKPLDQETAAINDLQRELALPENNAHLQLLNLAEWLGQLIEANKTFEELMMVRYSETSQRPDIQMKTARAEVDKVFRQILDLLEALVIVNGTATNAQFISELNAVMVRYKNILAQQKGHRKAKNEELKLKNKEQ